MLSHCSFNLYFSNNYDIILFFICLLPFCRMFFLKKFYLGALGLACGMWDLVL